VQWSWPVALYLLTKGVAAGAAVLAPFAGALGARGFAADWLPEVTAIAFTLITTALLVEDLKRPGKFLTLLTRGNRDSWLVKGAYVLIGFSITVPATMVARLAGLEALVGGLRWVSAALGLGVAGYTAFLFAQCEGRDLWQSKLLLPHLLAQAVLCGAVVSLPFAPALVPLALAASGVHVLLALAERFGRHATDNARQAAAFLGVVRLGDQPAWLAGLILSSLVAVPAILWAPMLAWIPVLVGLYYYEWAYVRAAQLPPLS